MMNAWERFSGRYPISKPSTPFRREQNSYDAPQQSKATAIQNVFLLQENALPTTSEPSEPSERSKPSEQVKRGRGRPKGSKNKPKPVASDPPKEKRRRGRPLGSKNKKKSTTFPGDRPFEIKSRSRFPGAGDQNTHPEPEIRSVNHAQRECSEHKKISQYLPCYNSKEQLSSHTNQQSIKQPFQQHAAPTPNGLAAGTDQRVGYPQHIVQAQAAPIDPNLTGVGSSNFNSSNFNSSNFNSSNFNSSNIDPNLAGIGFPDFRYSNIDPNLTDSYFGPLNLPGLPATHTQSHAESLSSSETPIQGHHDLDASRLQTYNLQANTASAAIPTSARSRLEAIWEFGLATNDPEERVMSLLGMRPRSPDPGNIDPRLLNNEV